MQDAEEATTELHPSVLLGAAATSTAPRESAFARRTRTLRSPTPVGRLAPGTTFHKKTDQGLSPVGGVIADPTARFGSEACKMEESRPAAQEAKGQTAAAEWRTTQTALGTANVKGAAQGAAQALLAAGASNSKQQTNVCGRQTTEELLASTIKQRNQGQQVQNQELRSQRWKEEPTVMQVSDLQAKESSVLKPGEDPQYKRKTIQRRQVSNLASIKATVSFFALLSLRGTMAQMEESDTEDSCPISDGLVALLIIGGFCLSYWIGWTLSSMDKSRWTYKWAVSEQLLILLTFLLSIVVALAAPFVEESCTGGRDYTALVLGIFDLFPRVISHAEKMLKMWDGKHVLSMVHGALERYLPCPGSEEQHLKNMIGSHNMIRQTARHQSKKFVTKEGEVLRAWDVTRFQEMKLSGWLLKPNWNKKKVIVSIAALLENTLHYTDLLDDTVGLWVESMKAYQVDLESHFLCALAVSLLNIKETLFGKQAGWSSRGKEFQGEHKMAERKGGQEDEMEDSKDARTYAMEAYSRSWLSRIQQMSEFTQIVDVDGRTPIKQKGYYDPEVVKMMRFKMSIISLETFIGNRKIHQEQERNVQCFRELVVKAAEAYKERRGAEDEELKTFLGYAVTVTELAYRWIIAIRICARTQFQMKLIDKCHEDETAAQWAACLIKCGLGVFASNARGLQLSVEEELSKGEEREAILKELASHVIKAIDELEDQRYEQKIQLARKYVLTRRDASTCS